MPFAEACSDVSSMSGKLPKTRWLSEGALPIVDQGDSVVAGYTNDLSYAYRGPLPVIVFGDHTRRFKFVDQSFAIGADGVKLLAPSPAIDARYLFRFFASIPLPSAGYSRHFKFLKTVTIPVPPLEEQQRIARSLDAVDALRTKRRKTIALATTFEQALFAEMFGASDTLESKPLEELVTPERPITYGIVQPGPHIPDGLPYVRVVDISASGIRTEDLRRTTGPIAAKYRRSTLATGDLVMSIRGHVGRLAVVPSELAGANLTQDSARLAIASYDRRYVMAAIRSQTVQSWLRRHTRGVAVRGINLADVRRIPIQTAPTAAQHTFSKRMLLMDGMLTNMTLHLERLNALFASIQYRAFNGELTDARPLRASGVKL
jgi:type I restriction enzyme S subunit